jgi:hypothetical protein
VSTFSTHTLDSTEALAVAITRDQYAHDEITHDQLEQRLHAILGGDGPDERIRVLTTHTEQVDITHFGDVRTRLATTAWRWPA